jgi:hypothetical protein
MRNTVAIFLLLISYSSFAIEKSPDDFFKLIEGEWAVDVPKSKVCEEKKFMHTILVSPDKKTITFRNHEVINDPHLGKVKDLIYNVIYSQENSAMLFIEGENRKAPSGDLVIWQLMLENKNYRWRIYGAPAGWKNNVIGVRCK